jgi:hypothetical protein
MRLKEMHLKEMRDSAEELPMGSALAISREP